MPSTLARRYAASKRLLCYQARVACNQRKVREWSFAMALLGFVETWNKRIDAERDPDELVFNLRALSDYAVSQAPNKSPHLSAALTWSAGVLARRILRTDERPSLDWMRDRAKRDGLFADAPAPAEPDIDERQLLLPVLQEEPEEEQEPEPVPIGFRPNGGSQ